MWGVLNNAGDEKLDNIRAYSSKESKRRAGITNDGTDNLIISYTEDQSDRIKTFHISSDTGIQNLNAGETGGEAKVGGVFGFRKH